MLCFLSSFLKTLLRHLSELVKIAPQAQLMIDSREPRGRARSNNSYPNLDNHKASIEQINK